MPSAKIYIFIVCHCFAFLLVSNKSQAQCVIKSDSIVCLDELLAFQAIHSKTANSYQWQFGDGTSSTQKNPAHAYDRFGKKNVSLTISFTDGTSCSVDTSIMVHDLPNASFVLSPDTQCINSQEFCLIDQSDMGMTTNVYEKRIVVWGDGEIDVEDNPSSGNELCYSNYLQATEYIVTGEVRNDKGCESKWSDTLVILPITIPSISVGFDDQTCDYREVCFENSSSSPPANISWFYFDFGNGVRDSVNWSKTCYQYTADPAEKARFKMEMQNGCTHTDSFNVEVDFKPVSFPGYLIDTAECYPQPFRLTTDDGSELPRYTYKVYNSEDDLEMSGSGIDTLVIYNLRMGDYYLEVIFSQYDCKDTVSYHLVVPHVNLNFTALNGEQCTLLDTVYFNNLSTWYEGSSPVFIWNFNDSNAGHCFDVTSNCNADSAFNSKHWYSDTSCYLPRLFAIDTNYGCQYQRSLELALGYRANPGIVKSLNLPCIGEDKDNAVRFEKTFCGGSIRADFDICEVEDWEGFTKSYTYTEVCDSAGWVSSRFAISQGSSKIYRSNDTSDYYIDNTRLCHDTVHYPRWFQLFKTPDNAIVKTTENCLPAESKYEVEIDPTFVGSQGVRIDWGNGLSETKYATDSIFEFTFTYENEGIYKQEFTITDTNQCRLVVRDTVYFGHRNRKSNVPVACPNKTTTFSSTIQFYFNDTLYWYDQNSEEKVKWVFSDGMVLNGPRVDRSFGNSHGVNYYTMYSTDRFGCIDSIEGEIYAQDIDVNIRLTDTFYLCDQIIQFFDSTQFDSTFEADPVKEYHWEFGDRTAPSKLRDPYHYYSSFGNKTIKHVVTTQKGCKDSAYADIYVEGPQPYFDIISDTIGCTPFTAFFESNSTRAKDFVWYFGDTAKSTYFVQTDTIIDFTYLKPGEYFIYLQGSDSFYNVSTDNYYQCEALFPDTNAVNPIQRKVKVLPIPEVDFRYEEPSCVGDPVLIMSLADTMYKKFNWSLDGVKLPYTNSNFSYVFAEEGEYVIDFTPTYIPDTPEGRACFDTASKTISVYKVEAEFSYDDLGCGDFQFYDSSYRAEYYSWEVQDRSSIRGEYFDEKDPFWSTSKDSAVYDVCLAISDSFGCRDTACTTLEIDNTQRLILYNIFTPEGDGLNDEYLFTAKGIAEFHLEIYNRWGERIFETTDPSEGWNGRVWNQYQELPAGSYFYLVKYRFICEEEGEESHGIVELVR